MATELDHLNLNQMILKRPNSQRIFRLLREMQHYGIKGNESHLVHGQMVNQVQRASAKGFRALNANAGKR